MLMQVDRGQRRLRQTCRRTRGCPRRRADHPPRRAARAASSRGWHSPSAPCLRCVAASTTITTQATATTSATRIFLLAAMAACRHHREPDVIRLATTMCLCADCIRECDLVWLNVVDGLALLCASINRQPPRHCDITPRLGTCLFFLRGCCLGGILRGHRPRPRSRCRCQLPVVPRERQHHLERPRRPKRR